MSNLLYFVIDIESSEWMWCERVVMGTWMLMTLVLARSYAGNLMSLLAVRFITEPYQTLRDVLDDPTVGLIIEEDGVNIPYFRVSIKCLNIKNTFSKWGKIKSKVDQNDHISKSLADN